MNMLKARWKNPYFWIALISIMIAASGVDFESFTSWSLLGNGILSILENPVKLVAVLIAGLGVVIDPTSKGILDKSKG